MALTNVDPQQPSTACNAMNEKPILEELQAILKNAEEWLDEPNAQFGGRPPRALIGTPEEHRLRDMIRSVKQGQFA